jgi:hypothetical protein
VRVQSPYERARRRERVKRAYIADEAERDEDDGRPVEADEFEDDRR